jgi:alkyl hydroperoxide reductase subunit AhpC
MKTVNPKQSGQSILALRRFVGEGAEEPKKAVILSFSASYCEPCKKEMAELKKLEPRFKKAQVVLAIVIIDSDQEGIDKMTKYAVDELALPYPVLADRYNILARRYHADTLPHVVLIDPAGKVGWVHSGYDEGGIQELLKRTGA